MITAAVSDPNDGLLTEDELDKVVGGLARPLMLPENDLAEQSVSLDDDFAPDVPFPV